MELRPYQNEAIAAIQEHWQRVDRTLLVLPTGCGKTIVFCRLAAKLIASQGARVLILAHRGELLEQAADKMHKATGLGCATEKAEHSCLEPPDCWFRIVVGSVQSLMRPQRLAKFKPGHFDVIVVDEAHHCLADSYQRVLDHFSGAKVLGVTATPDRGDMKNLGQYFESLAYSYTLPQAIKEGYLVPIKALTIPLRIELAGLTVNAGDFTAKSAGNALDPYLEQIAEAIIEHAPGRKIVIFLPLIATSQKMLAFLQARGVRAAEVNGNSEDRAEVLHDFEHGKYDVLCNSMLLCLDMETEILTDKGFVKHEDMTLHHRVANWQTDGSVFFAEPAEIVCRELYEHEHMVSIDSRTINMRVTNTHRMVVSCGAGGKNWKKIPAGELRNGHQLPSTGVAAPADISIAPFQHPPITKRNLARTAHTLRKKGICATREESYAEALRRKQRIQRLQYRQPAELTLDDCRFIGFWIADGSCGTPGGGREYTLSQARAYPVIIHWVDQLLTRMQLDFRRHERTTPVCHVRWSLARGTGSGCQANNGVFHLEPYLCKDGVAAFWGLSESQFDALVEGYWYGDGHHGQAESGMPRSICMNDTNKAWIELLQAIGSVRGWRTSMHERPQKKRNHRTQWYLRMIKQRPLHISCRTKIVHEPHKPEQVWCVKTQSKNIITRRRGKVTVMGNTEGWDCPSVDCVVCLRPTKVRALYVQIVGRGTRLSPDTGKTDLLVLDFLWHTDKHELCRPAHLICESPEVATKMVENMEAAPGEILDLEEAEEQAETDCVAEREEALAKKLEAMKRRKQKLVDPLQFEMSIQAEDLANYVPAFGWEMAPPSDKQVAALEKRGIMPDDIGNAGKAALVLDRLQKRQSAGLSTPKQIRFLEGKGFQHVGQWEFDAARKMIDRIAGNRWRVPRGIVARDYQPTTEGKTDGSGQPTNTAEAGAFWQRVTG